MGNDIINLCVCVGGGGLVGRMTALIGEASKRRRPMARQERDSEASGGGVQTPRSPSELMSF